MEKGYAVRICENNFVEKIALNESEFDDLVTGTRGETLGIEIPYVPCRMVLYFKSKKKIDGESINILASFFHLRDLRNNDVVVEDAYLCCCHVRYSECCAFFTQRLFSEKEADEVCQYCNEILIALLRLR